MTKEYQEYLESPEWKEFRIKAFAHYGKRCSKCKTTKNLQIHHLHYNNIFNEKLEDVKVLCKKHHEEAHGIKQPKKRSKKQIKKQNRKLAKKERKNLRRLKNNMKSINTRLPTVDDIIQNKRDRVAWQIRVAE